MILILSFSFIISKNKKIYYNNIHPFPLLGLSGLFVGG